MQQMDGRKARGDESRRTVLARAIDIASMDGLEGLTIGRLASDVSASKSGVAALFGSKEQLQLATIEAASAVFTEAVIEPARAYPRGLRRVCALVRLWLGYSAERVFEGGCFFLAASVEYDSKPGPVRDGLLRTLAVWDGYLAASIGYAMEQGELPGLTDAEQLAFEINAIFNESNTRSLLHDSRVPYDRARTAIAARLLGLGAGPAALAEAGLG
ncbi:TetR/AcrR family transcriptional regulator [Arthrobacter sp. CJ23]|uniref:TetR/AcrR family transcriptional regulator n=1 Tax=Arthrobacter sp. CJ23 TaxID=2972479 RepID=UPI00215D043D|nr:TetR/AcrR family transcriptional regulator [Arthrobacter sp. CJ23]UVJ39859.1 TetR/AcrR family transcriptional regulator [Arthrobacter sp. CJ23]